MKVIPLYSSVDIFIIASIAFITGLIMFKFIIRKLNYSKKESIHTSEDEDFEIDLSQYTLNFDVLPVGSKNVSFGSKLVLFALALTIIIIPLYEFITKLTPEVVYYGCILF